MCIKSKLLAGYITHKIFIKRKGEEWFKQEFLPKIKPVSIIALLLTIGIIICIPGKYHCRKFFNNSVSINSLGYSNLLYLFFVIWIGGRMSKLPHSICSPVTMITVVGVLVGTCNVIISETG